MNPTEPETVYPHTWASRSPLCPIVPPKDLLPSLRQTSQVRNVPLGVRDVNSVSK